MNRDRAADANVTVREASPDDRLGVRRVLDAAMLDVREDLRECIAAGDVLVAREVDEDETPVLGALVLVSQDETNDGSHANEGGRCDAHVDAVAVRRSRRGKGIGSALVRTAAERHARLTAEFDADVRPFYESLGFEIEAVGGENDRLRGRYESRSA